MSVPNRLRRWGFVLGILAVGVLIGSALSQYLAGPPPAEEPPAAGVVQVTERVRVEVLNGGGVSGVARAATQILRDAGFDVVTYQNAENFSESPSVVVDRAGRRHWAEQAALLLGIGSVESRPDSAKLLEVTVVLGQEWRPPEQEPPTRTERPWWDPRGYIGGPR